MDPAVFGDRWSTLRCGDPHATLRVADRIVDATAHERRLRGHGFGADFSLVGRSTGGTSAPVVAAAAASAVGAPGSLRLRVGGSSPSSGASQIPPYEAVRTPDSQSAVHSREGGAGPLMEIRCLRRPDC